MPEPGTALAHARALAAPAPLPRLESALTRLLAAAYRLLGRSRYDDFRLEQVAGLTLLVLPSVFNPRLLRTGAYFAERLDAALVPDGCEVLDMGTGSGVCALMAARRARRVVAVDINPAAVRCARLNSLLNRLDGRVEVRGGDLFTAVAGERFDRVLFNPPFKPGAPRDDRDRAWRAGDVAERFAAGLRAHLRPGGSALLLLSSYGDAAPFLLALEREGFAIGLEAGRRFIGERVAIFRATPLGGAALAAEGAA